MTKIFYLLLIPAVLLASCNNDIFIKPLTVSATEIDLSPENPSATVEVSGDWWVETIVFGYQGHSRQLLPANGVYSLDIAQCKLQVVEQPGALVFTLDYLMGIFNGSLLATVTDGYQRYTIDVTLHPLDASKIEVERIYYNLDSWSGWPGDNYTWPYITMSFPQGFSKPTTYTFPQPESIPTVYRFINWNFDNEFANMVLSSGLIVPVPSLGDAQHQWMLSGQTAALSLNQSLIEYTKYGLENLSVDIPANTPVQIQLMVDYECVGFDCSISAKDSATGLAQTFDCQYVTNMPVKVYATYEVIK